MSKKNMDERIKALEEAVYGRKTTRIAVVQDRSGSMQGLRDATISGYNEWLSTQQKDDSDDAYLTLVQFDDQYKVSFSNRALDKCKPLNHSTYTIGGMTALYDAVGRAINELEQSGSDDDRYLVVIMTDGYENSSKEFKGDQIKGMIQERQDRDNWTFVFLGAGVDEMIGQGLGIFKGNTLSYSPTVADTTVTYANLATATSSVRASSGTSTSNFTLLMEDDKEEDEDEDE